MDNIHHIPIEKTPVRQLPYVFGQCRCNLVHPAETIAGLRQHVQRWWGERSQELTQKLVRWPIIPRICSGYIHLLVLNVGNGWEWGLLEWLLLVIMDHSRRFPAFSTRKFRYNGDSLIIRILFFGEYDKTVFFFLSWWQLNCFQSQCPNSVLGDSPRWTLLFESMSIGAIYR